MTSNRTWKRRSKPRFLTWIGFIVLGISVAVVAVLTGALANWLYWRVF